MTYAERVQHWNRLYDQAPEDIRFNVVVFGVVLIGAVNMLLTVLVGFPFALLVVLAIAALTAIRLPLAMGWLQAEAGGAPAQLRIEGWDSLWRLNRWYDGLTEFQQLGTWIGVLVAAGAINMLLTIGNGFPFGVLFLLALLGLVAARGPYTAGWLAAPAEPPAPATPRLAQETQTTLPATDAPFNVQPIRRDPPPA